MPIRSIMEHPLRSRPLLKVARLATCIMQAQAHKDSFNNTIELNSRLIHITDKVCIINNNNKVHLLE